jgi:hypothetical protein
MSKMSDADVYESVWTQIAELGEIEEGDVALICRPLGCGEDRFNRILKQVETDMEKEAAEIGETA